MEIHGNFKPCFGMDGNFKNKNGNPYIGTGHGGFDFFSSSKQFHELKLMPALNLIKFGGGKWFSE